LLLVFFFIAIGVSIRMPIPSYKSGVTEGFPFDENRLKQHVKTLSEDLIPRTCERPLELQRAAHYVKNQFLEWNADTELQTYNIGNRSFSNVVSTFGGDSERAIVVGAHYDAFAALPGADDNASGVAGLLELGRALSATHLDSRVILIAYACEEPPYFATDGMGSYFHANSIEANTVRLMISLEMIGYFSDGPDSQTFPIPGLSLLYPTTGDYAAVVGKIFTLDAARLKATINRETTIDAYSINAPTTIVGVDFSDHRNYWSLGVPAVMVTDTAFFRNPNYHTGSDTFDTLDYEKMRAIIQGVYSYVLKISEEI